MKKFIFFLLFLFLYCSGEESDISNYETEIKELLKNQVEAWNSGSVEGFMNYYWKSDNFTFQSGNNRVEGWETLKLRYEKNYSGDKMGRLNFTDLSVKILTPEYAFVQGRWKVTTGENSSQGLFTLIMRRMYDTWKIIHDHTSSEAKN